jgi:hypothetical protein
MNVISLSSSILKSSLLLKGYIMPTFTDLETEIYRLIRRFKISGVPITELPTTKNSYKEINCRTTEEVK